MDFLTHSGTHLEVADRTVEQNQRQTFQVKLVGRRLEDSVKSSLEVSSGNDFERVSDVDDQRTGPVWNIVPLLIPAPDLETRHRHREQLSGQAEIGMGKHLSGNSMLALYRLRKSRMKEYLTITRLS